MCRVPIWSGLVAFSLILCLSACLEVPETKELLDNPSFEDGIRGWSVGSGEVAIEEVGNNRVLFLNNSSVSQRVMVKEGEILCFSCVIYDLSFGEYRPFAMISFYDKNGKFLTNRRTYQYVRGAWFNVSISFEASKASSFAIISLIGSEKSYFDNTSLMPSAKKPYETFYSIRKEYDLFVGMPYWYSLPESGITIERGESNNRLQMRGEDVCWCSQAFYSESDRRVLLKADIDIINGEAGVCIMNSRGKALFTDFPQSVDLTKGWNHVTLFVMEGEAYFDNISLGGRLENSDFENETLCFDAYFNIPIDFWNQRFAGIGYITVDGAELVDAEVTETVGSYLLPRPNHVLRIEIEGSAFSNITLSFEADCIVSGTPYYREEEETKYLVATETIQANHPYIIENATALGNLCSIVDFVGNLKTFYSPEQDALSTLLNGGDMCVGTSRLECALLRARGIPARAIYVYIPNFSPTHWMCEAYWNGNWLRIEQDTKQCPAVLQGSVAMLSLEPEMENVANIELWRDGELVRSAAGCNYEGFSNPCIYYGKWGSPPRTDYIAIDI